MELKFEWQFTFNYNTFYIKPGGIDFKTIDAKQVSSNYILYSTILSIMIDHWIFVPYLKIIIGSCNKGWI